MSDEKYLRAGLDFARGRAIEELGELQAALGKSLRWGWNSSNPELPIDQREMNVDWVKREISDVKDALLSLERELQKACECELEGCPGECYCVKWERPFSEVRCPHCDGTGVCSKCGGERQHDQV